MSRVWVRRAWLPLWLAGWLVAALALAVVGVVVLPVLGASAWAGHRLEDGRR